jgi:uncharacterized protein
MADRARFEWDPRKSEANRRKHGIDFRFASRVFYDPLKRLDIEGDEHGEIRWRTIGEINGKLYVVSHTTREEGEEEIHRIITARTATPRDRAAFEETS